MARGLQDIPYRIPEKWDPIWFETFIREVLAKADIRNAIEGAGITIDGQSDVPATISSSEDLLDLIEQNFILATSSSFLNNERILTGETGVVDTHDEGPGGEFIVGIENGGIGPTKFRQSVEYSVVGRPQGTPGYVSDIQATANDLLLTRVADRVDFTQLTLGMAPDAIWTFSKIQDADAMSVLGRSANTSGVLDEIVAASDGDVLRRNGTAVGFGQIVETAIADGSLLARVASNETISGTWTFTGATTLLSSTEPRLLLGETDQASNEDLWDIDVQGKTLRLRTRTTADGAGRDAMAVSRGTGVALSQLTFGNSTDNPTGSWLGTGAFTFGGPVTTSGGRRVSIRAITATASVLDSDEIITCNATSGAITVNLPALSGNLGRRLTVKKTDNSANAVTLDGNSSENIDGATTLATTTQYASFTVVAGASEWHVI